MSDLRKLAGRLMATTEFGADAHTVLTAAAEIERLARELAEAKERGDRAAAEVGRLREAYDSLVGPAAYAGALDAAASRIFLAWDVKGSELPEAIAELRRVFASRAVPAPSGIHSSSTTTTKG